MQASWTAIAPNRDDAYDDRGQLRYLEPFKDAEDFGVPLRLTQAEWQECCETDRGTRLRFFCHPRFTMTQDIALVASNIPGRQAEYAEYYEVRLRHSRSSKVFGPYYRDAHGRTMEQRARTRVLRYLVEHGAVQLLQLDHQPE